MMHEIVNCSGGCVSRNAACLDVAEMTRVASSQRDEAKKQPAAAARVTGLKTK